MGSISLLQVLITWPDADVDTSTVTQLDSPKEAEYGKTVETPKAIATYLKLWNQLHFGQAHGTPFTVLSLGSELNYIVIGARSLNMSMEGEYNNITFRKTFGALQGSIKAWP
eukprot:15100643-Ditylum_brightwellii.AAC.1